MSRRLWRCRNPECGAVLGRVTFEEGLVLGAEARLARVYLDTRKAIVACRCCGQVRTFRGRSVFPDTT
jgi:hypothetical protein